MSQLQSHTIWSQHGYVIFIFKALRIKESGWGVFLLWFPLYGSAHLRSHLFRSLVFFVIQISILQNESIRIQKMSKE